MNSDGNAYLLKRPDDEMYLILRYGHNDDSFVCYNIDKGYITNRGSYKIAQIQQAIRKDKKLGQAHIWDIEPILKGLMEGRD